MSITESKIHYDRIIETVVLLLMAIGTVFVFSAGATVRGGYDLSQFYNFTTIKQLIFFPLAVAVMYVVSLINYHRFSIMDRPPGYSLTPYLAALALVLLIIVLFWGVERNYSKRWLDLAPGPVYVSFQPSELAKWVMILFLAAYLERFADEMNLFWKRFVPVCLSAGLVVGLIVIEDFGTAAFIVMITFLMLLYGGARLWHLLSPLPVIIPAFVAAILASPTRINRIKSFLDPENMQYQARQSLIAISTGGLFGKGLGRGIIKYDHLPEDTTDFIFAIIAEEMGFAACVVVIVLFLVFAIAGMGAVFRCRDPFGRMIGIGIVMAITLQAAVNIGVVTVVLPTKGIPLPFISAGGTSMLLTSAAVGVLLNIARHGDDPSSDDLLPEPAMHRGAAR
ncbi:MAG: putative lipid II flippase FtsW [Planctomycetales bacterium]|nr:putative lipid II flippase FtsW [Planctomycetales bacterium]